MDRIGEDLTLDHIDNWFKIGGKVNVKSVPRFKVEGGRPVDPNTLKPYANTDEHFVPPYKRHERVNNPCQTAYASHYQQLDADNLFAEQVLQEKAESVAEDEITSQMTGALEQLDLSSTYTGGGRTKHTTFLPEGVTEEEAIRVYNNYNFSHQYDQKLAITKHRHQILDTVESNQVTVIEGETGSGKTTQVPQYILDHYRQQNRFCSIVVTQPRRIAAISIAKRVSHERGWQLGNLCGYQVGLDCESTQDTRILYCTTGILLRKLITEKNMLRYTHVILDEVHERDQESDFCLLVARKLLRTNSRGVKLFANYFALNVRGRLEPAPVCKVQGRHYKVQEFYLEDLARLGELPAVDIQQPEISVESQRLTCQLIHRFDDLDRQKRPGDGETPIKKGSVLIFLPGIQEIHDMDQALRQMDISPKLTIRPLHSSITSEEQAKVFDRVQLGNRKIILSTNIAESSITVPDIEYVIDFCLTKSQVCDPETNYTKLELQWASKANCTQRKGRAGRVSDGRVYRMVTRRFFDQFLEDYGTPEMQSSPLSQVVLQVKVFDLGEPKAILGLALSPPNLDDIEKTVLMLKEVGALASLASGEVNPHDGELTFLGQALASLPVDIHLGRLMLLGHVFGLLRETIIISAALSLKSFFAQPFKGYLQAYKHRLAWAERSFSDCLAYLNAFDTWSRQSEMGLFHTIGKERDWCRKNYIQMRRIHEVRELCIELASRLKNINIRTPSNIPPNDIDDPDTQLLLKLTVCGAFYPNYFTLSGCDEQEALKTLAGKNPFYSVMLKSLPSNQGALYRKNIEDMFRDCELRERAKIYFEETRAYVEFPRDSTTQSINSISTAVYLAVKLRQIGVPLVIEPFSESVIQEKLDRMRELQLNKLQQRQTNRSNFNTTGGDPQQVALPSPQQNSLELNITEVVDCGHFWGHYGDDDTWAQLSKLQMDINREQPVQQMNQTDVTEGCLVLALYSCDEVLNYYRARVHRVNLHTATVQVFFVDYGNIEEVRVGDLRPLPPRFLRLPFQAMEFELSGVRPSVMKCPTGQWTKEAKSTFRRLLDQLQCFIANVYSVVDGVVRVELVGKDSDGATVSLNKTLIDKCYADRAEESLASKQNHELRETESVLNPGNLMQSGPGSGVRLLSDVVSTTERRAERGPRQKIVLNGPWSGLEMSFDSMTAIGNQRPTRIQRDGVNSVALDSEPQCSYDRMMVAAYVGLNPSGGTLMAYDTTLMPSVRGLPALMALTFAPTAELRTDPERTRYTGALCGLGWDQSTRGPALPDHDMEVTFDTVIDGDDINLINRVRMSINLAIGADNHSADWARDQVIKIQRNARDAILELVKRRREPLEPKPFLRRYRWNQVSVEHLRRPMYETLTETSILLNLHSQVALTREHRAEDEEEMKRKRDQAEMLAHLEELRSKASRSTEPENITCKLCQTRSANPNNLRFHLGSMWHRKAEMEFMQRVKSSAQGGTH